ncbi:MAG TPA: methylmalonyl Co-A mutase-associated GTPase MeaB [Burkholderiaceae bacterium]|nr:methylmalonyl Co-A mutase-associated GTPase MeaB [Burkholderiaceae bacterium]
MTAKSSAAPLAPADHALVTRLRAGERRALAKAITLIESTRRDDQKRGRAVLEALLPHAAESIRIGISGAPGVGKSTFIESLGLHLIARGHRVAVLAVDPSSSVTGGSILADKTRMEELSRSPHAFIRPSPAGGSLGGVAARTREALSVCEAAGFDVIIVETVGVGQSETAVARMTDLMVLLQLPNAGDELQALKKGIVELADIIVVNKADLDPHRAAQAQHMLKNTLAILRSSSPNWRPPVLALSALTGDGVERFWNEVERYRSAMRASGEFVARRRGQAQDWMWQLIDERLRADFHAHPEVAAQLPDTVAAVASGSLTPAMAAERLLAQSRKPAPDDAR